MNQKFCVYIIYSQSHDLYYKGCTKHLELRLLQHNHNKSRFTEHKGPWKLVFTQSFSNKTQALIREKSIKKYSHQQLRELISSDSNEI